MNKKSLLAVVSALLLSACTNVSGTLKFTSNSPLPVKISKKKVAEIASDHYQANLFFDTDSARITLIDREGRLQKIKIKMKERNFYQFRDAGKEFELKPEQTGQLFVIRGLAQDVGTVRNYHLDFINTYTGQKLAEFDGTEKTYSGGGYQSRSGASGRNMMIWTAVMTSGGSH